MWRHTEKLCHWNLRVDDAACEGLRALLGLMRDARWPSKKILRVSRPTAPLLNLPTVYADEFAIQYAKGQAPDDLWSLKVVGARVELHLGLARLRQFSDALETVAGGVDDFAIGTDEEPLWLWSRQVL